MGSKNDPGAFDCYAKAEPDEPTFTLLGRDPAAWATVIVWTKIREELGLCDPGQLEEARACAVKLEAWARGHGKGDAVEELLAGGLRDALAQVRKLVGPD